VTSGIMLAVYTIVEGRDSGWSLLQTIVLGGLAGLLLAAFVVRQATAPKPLLPLTVFRSRSVSGANLAQVFMVAGMFGMFFLGALYLQRVLGYDPLQIGLAFLPVAIAIGLLSFRFAAQLIDRFGARAVLLAGLGSMLAGLALFVRAPTEARYVTDVLPSMLLVGVGGGLSFPALMTLGMSGASDSDSGLISGLLNTTAQVGGSVGLAALATLATYRSDGLLAAGESSRAALTAGYQLAFAAAAALLALALAVAATLLTSPAVAGREAEAGDDAASSEEAA
jgi:MFS family permease